jgi:hypothetical protein
MDWNYEDTNAVQFRDTLDAVRATGHRGIGAPGLISYRWGPRAGTKSLRNIDAFADAYIAADNPASLGVILTNWVPCRYIQNSIWDGFAYAAVLFSDSSATAHATGYRRFVERHYGAQWNEMWSEAFQLIYDAAPAFGEIDTSSSIGLRLPVPFSDEESLAALLKNRVSISNPFKRLRRLLVLLKPSVLKTSRTSGHLP